MEKSDEGEERKAEVRIGVVFFVIIIDDFIERRFLDGSKFIVGRRETEEEDEEQ